MLKIAFPFGPSPDYFLSVSLSSFCGRNVTTLSKIYVAPSLPSLDQLWLVSLLKTSTDTNISESFFCWTTRRSLLSRACESLKIFGRNADKIGLRRPEVCSFSVPKSGNKL